jgi:hypothetical protein
MSPAAGFAGSPIRGLASVLWLAGFAGCYNPGTPLEGAPCQRSEQCPEPQQCVLGSCSLSARPPVDARPPPPSDARVDAMVDAMPVPCVADGLTCASGTLPSVFPCGTHCWVKCTEALPRATAETRCNNWMGALGEIDDATEQTCVASHISTATFWIGAIQGNPAATADAGWTWNGATRIVYSHWAAGEPEDGNGMGSTAEHGVEQCGTIRPDGWDDSTCNSPLPFFCARPLFR